MNFEISLKYDIDGKDTKNTIIVVLKNHELAMKIWQNGYSWFLPKELKIDPSYELNTFSSYWFRILLRSSFSSEKWCPVA